MKTPWRFVADLVSRKPKADSHDRTSAVAPTTLALEYLPANEEALPNIATTATDLVPATHDETSTAPSPEPHPTPAVVETSPPIEEDVPDVSVAVAESAKRPSSPQQEKAPSPAAQTFPANTEAAETPVKPVSVRRKKVEPITEALASEGQTGEVPPALAAGPKSFLEEMADLDAEVDVLRCQLAGKLAEQNAQLRRMLARFDGR